MIIYQWFQCWFISGTRRNRVIKDDLSQGLSGLVANLHSSHSSLLRKASYRLRSLFNRRNFNPTLMKMVFHLCLIRFSRGGAHV